MTRAECSRRPTRACAALALTQGSASFAAASKTGNPSSSSAWGTAYVRFKTACILIRDGLPGRDSAIQRRTGLTARWNCTPSPRMTAITATANSTLASRMPRYFIGMVRTPRATERHLRERALSEGLRAGSLRPRAKAVQGNSGNPDYSGVTPPRRRNRPVGHLDWPVRDPFTISSIGHLARRSERNKLVAPMGASRSLMELPIHSRRFRCRNRALEATYPRPDARTRQYDPTNTAMLSN